MSQRYSKKILHIVNIPWYSGLGAYARDMARHMEKKGSEVSFAVPRGSKLYRKLKKEFKIIQIPGRKPLQTLRGLFVLLKKRKEYDAVISHTGSSFFVGFFMKMLNPKISLLRTRAERGFPSSNFFNRILHRRAGGIIVATEKIKKKFIMSGMDPAKILVLPPPIDTELFHPGPFPRENVITVVGRLGRVKGHMFLIKALPLIEKKLKKVKLVFAGKETNVRFKSLLRKARSLGVNSDIVYKGQIGRKEVARLMRNSSVGIIASVASEEVSRVALEWIASGRPLVASDVGCIREFLEPSNAALIVEPENEEEMARAIVKLLKDKKLIKEMGEKARKRALDFFSDGKYAKNLEILYDIIERF